MIRGIYTTAAALATATLRLGVVSNNVANASTPGYKQDRLPEEVGKPIDLMRWAVDSQGRSVGSITLGPQVGVSQLDLTPGPIQETSNPLDLALAGTGFFAVQAPDGTTKYTRDGGFHADPDGSVRGRDGSSVLDTNGQAIVLPIGADVSVAADGTVTRSQPRPIGATVVGAVCFLVVLVAIGYGITYLVATGGGHKVSFSHGYPHIYNA